jgi:hypothetical protein
MTRVRPLLPLLVLGLVASMGARAGVLVTPRFVVVIAEQCAEGDVACDKVVYTGVDRRSGAALTLHGKAWVHLCADRVTPCRHLGWRFANGGTTYAVSDDGLLEVTRDGRSVVHQQGKWVE